MRKFPKDKILRMMRLKDNTFYNSSDIFLRKSLLNYFSVPIKQLKDKEGVSVLIYPQSFSDSVDEVGEQIVFDITKRDADGNPVEFWTRNLVGFISYKGQEITICSRFSGEKSDNFLYYMLARVAGLNLLSLDFSSQKQSRGLNLMLFLFPKLLKEAFGQGLFKQYIYKEYNDANIRGPIDINRHIRRNIPFNGRVAYRTREFSYDNPLTQLVRHAIEWIKTSPWGQSIINSDETTKIFIREIIAATPTYETRKRQEIINHNLRPVVHPFFSAWQPLQEFCLRLLQYESLSYGTDKKNKIHGLLIDAAWLWEEYVAKVLAESKSGLKHYTRSSQYHLFKTATGKTFQQIIPDYYDGDKIVADAKYIPLHRYDHLDAERASAVYYKTIMYMYRFNTQKGYLFHPCSVSDVEEMEKKPTEFEHLKIDENKQTVSCEYEIVDREGCHLHEVGMIVPSTEKYDEFKSSMDIIEEAFVQLIR